MVDWQKEKKLSLDDESDEDDTTLTYRVDGTASPPKTQKIYYYHESSGPTQLLIFADKPKHRKKRLLGLVGGSRDDEVEDDVEEEDEDMKEIPDASGPPAKSGIGLFGTKQKAAKAKLATIQDDPEHKSSDSPMVDDGEMGELDGGLARFDPSSATDADRALQAQLEEKTGTRLVSAASSSAPPHPKTGRPYQPIPIPADYTSAGVLQVTVIGANGFKASRKRMFAGVVFNDLIKRTSVIHNSRQPKWETRMTFRADVDNEEFQPTTCFCCSGSVVGTDAKSKTNKQILYVNIYEKTSLSDHFLGCATINLREIGFAHTDGWFDVLKYKGRKGMVKRGQVHLGIWWQQEAESAAEALAQQIREEPNATTTMNGQAGITLQTDRLAGPVRLHRIVSGPEHIEHAVGTGHKPRFRSSANIV